MSRLTLICGFLLVAGSCSSEPASGDDPRGTPGTKAGAGIPKLDIPRVKPPQLPAQVANSILAAENILDSEPALHIGMQAPKLRVDGWLQGKPVRLAPGSIYVVENWATWCKPCVAAMPHLSTLADNYRGRDVVVVAINVETKASERDMLAQAKDFVAKRAQEIRYPVAYEHNGYVENTWLKPAGLRGIPASFVVDKDGTIAWIGHPERLPDIVEQVASGTWNATRARARASRERLAIPYSKRIVELLTDEPDRAYRLIRAVIARVLYDQPDYLAGLAYHIYAGPGVEKRDLELAYLAGALACQRTEWSQPDMIETLSKIRQQQGQRDLAIVLQNRAVAAAGDKARRARYRARLDLLQTR